MAKSKKVTVLYQLHLPPPATAFFFFFSGMQLFAHTKILLTLLLPFAHTIPTTTLKSHYQLLWVFTSMLQRMLRLIALLFKFQTSTHVL